MPPVDRALCRKAAKECTELASVTSDPETRQLLLMRAQEWLKLAYSNSEDQFEQLLFKFNSEQLGGSSAVHRQPMQEQQTKRKSD
jgi:hypothetical protein